MKRVDGDSALLWFFIVVGAIPVVSDALYGRAFGAQTTVALALVLASALALARRKVLQLRARALRRQLLASGRCPR